MSFDSELLSSVCTVSTEFCSHKVTKACGKYACSGSYKYHCIMSFACRMSSFIRINYTTNFCTAFFFCCFLQNLTKSTHLFSAAFFINIANVSWVWLWLFYDDLGLLSLFYSVVLPCAYFDFWSIHTFAVFLVCCFRCLLFGTWSVNRVKTGNVSSASCCHNLCSCSWWLHQWR